ncbi:MAG: methyltransferase domain-containing protein [Gemmatimonadaceae bacterium]|jgi:predicted nicotinamide N-methyase|nr:methyltransferase domain-containing protein [Gemmatimonadaceae bacterium]
MRPELATLDRRFMLVPQEVALPMGVVTLEKPRSADDLISEADFAEDDRLPYWADLWPAAIVLSTWLETHPAAPHADGSRPRAIELGCGLGLVTTAATRAGYDVLATDYYVDATLLTARNALTVTGREPAVRMVDWRSFPDDLGTFDLVLAADVLYERPYAPLVAEAIRRTLAPDGRALVSDQGRVALGDFLVEAKARHLVPRIVHHETRPTVPAAPEGSAVHSITVYELRHA